MLPLRAWEDVIFLSSFLHYHDNPHPIMSRKAGERCLGWDWGGGETLSASCGFLTCTCARGTWHCQHLEAKRVTYVSTCPSWTPSIHITESPSAQICSAHEQGRKESLCLCSDPKPAVWPRPGREMPDALPWKKPAGGSSSSRCTARLHRTAPAPIKPESLGA